MDFEYAIIVKNKTRLETLNTRFNTKAQSKFYIERSGGNFNDYELEHHNFQRSLTKVQQQLSKVIKNKIVERNFLPSFLFNEKNLIIVIGQDGLVANTAKYVNDIPIIAINPDKERYDGVLLPFSPDNFIEGVQNVLAGKYQSHKTVLAEAVLNDGQRLLAFNDLFIGASSHISARYRISYDNITERQSSSGIIVSTQSGSTGWLSSIFNMTHAIHQYIEEDNEAKKIAVLGDDELVFVVREPFQSKVTQIGLVAGVLDEGTKLEVESFMPTNGVIFSDGIEADFLNFNSGSIATVGVAKERANLVLNV